MGAGEHSALKWQVTPVLSCHTLIYGVGTASSGGWLWPTLCAGSSMQLEHLGVNARALL